ncbi:unnamed protein product, partial [Ectocarpus sp. 4 AP-2014]
LALSLSLSCGCVYFSHVHACSPPPSSRGVVVAVVVVVAVLWVCVVLFSGEIEHAEPLHRRALEIRLERLGSDHKDVAFSLHNLSLVYSSRGDDEEAGRYMSRANKIWEMAYAKPPGDGDDDAPAAAAAAASADAGADGGEGESAGAGEARASRTPSGSSSSCSAASESSSRSGDVILSPAAAAAAAAADAGWTGVMGSMFGGSSGGSNFFSTAPSSVERARRSLCGENKVGCTTS